MKIRPIFILSLICLFTFLMTNNLNAAASCTGTVQSCSLITSEYRCDYGGGLCSSDDDCYYGYCSFYQYLCDGKNSCDCNWIPTGCNVSHVCHPGETQWTYNCTCNPWWDCTTTCGYAGGWVDDGCGGLVWCSETEACCTNSDPDTPTLYAPGTGTSVPVNQSVNLDWNAISSWGTGCPQDNDYEVCVMSNNSTCDYVNLTAQGDSNTNYNGWTPTAGDDLVYWKIRAHNGSNTVTSSTWNFCVEDQLCTFPQCGEDRRCSVPNCPNTDAGAPIPTIATPAKGTVTTLPVTFTWSVGDTRPESFNISYDNGTSQNIGKVYSYSITSSNVGGTGSHTLKVQSKNTTCVDAGQTSAWATGTFCYDTELCDLKCGQARACSANCGVDDAGVPGVPVISYPIGTISSPIILSPGTTGVTLSLSGGELVKLICIIMEFMMIVCIILG